MWKFSLDEFCKDWCQSVSWSVLKDKTNKNQVKMKNQNFHSWKTLKWETLKFTISFFLSQNVVKISIFMDISTLRGKQLCHRIWHMEHLKQKCQGRKRSCETGREEAHVEERGAVSVCPGLNLLLHALCQLSATAVLPQLLCGALCHQLLPPGRGCWP